MSRLKRMQESGVLPAMPPTPVAAHLIEHLMDAGPVLHTGMGPAPLSWSEIVTWQQATGVDLSPWEAQTLRNLSAEYIAAGHEAEEADAPAPYSPAPTPDNRARVAASVASIFGARARQHQPKAPDGK